MPFHEHPEVIDFLMNSLATRDPKVPDNWSLNMLCGMFVHVIASDSNFL